MTDPMAQAKRALAEKAIEARADTVATGGGEWMRCFAIWALLANWLGWWALPVIFGMVMVPASLSVLVKRRGLKLLDREGL